MGKIRGREWLGLIPSIMTTLVLGIIWIITGFQKPITYYLIVIILFFIYLLTHTFWFYIFEWGESKLKYDEELIKLEKTDSAMLWGFTIATGFSFIFAGIEKIGTNPTITIMGLIILIVGNLIYYGVYFPRYRYLVRKRLIALNSKN
ncbi:hypothetical protein COU60_02410 [Candidatus Pacearchaeota archaeon CG10_big_fil_rev_8_21_14_0_10_34_76]|nr:MAG: hypothetical protein COU60_02410 [Candidatus Pacearchaeota archaeon CG10_big_fil_rev_8_21_14_0_10_34_76]